MEPSPLPSLELVLRCGRCKRVEAVVPLDATLVAEAADATLSENLAERLEHIGSSAMQWFVLHQCPPEAPVTHLRKH